MFISYINLCSFEKFCHDCSFCSFAAIIFAKKKWKCSGHKVANYYDSQTSIGSELRPILIGVLRKPMH